jgi:hypothetical protein
MLNSTRLQTARPFLAVFTVLVAFQPFFILAQDKGSYQEEADRLAVLLDWQPVSTVAEIGSGSAGRRNSWSRSLLPPAFRSSKPSTIGPTTAIAPCSARRASRGS